MKKNKTKAESLGINKLYLSGPIRLYGVTRARKEFESTKVEMEKLGFEVVTPFDNGLSDDAPYEEHMKADLKLLEECDAVCMLLNWQESEGAKREHEAAQLMDKDIIYQNKARC